MRTMELIFSLCPEKALPLLERAVKLDPTNAVAHFRLSTLYRKMGRAEDANRELAEYQKFKTMKEKLRDTYRQCVCSPTKRNRKKTRAINLALGSGHSVASAFSQEEKAPFLCVVAQHLWKEQARHSRN